MGLTIKVPTGFDYISAANPLPVSLTGAINGVPIGNTAPSTGAFTTLSANASTASTSTTTGALVVPNGGVGIGGALNVGGSLSAGAISGTTGDYTATVRAKNGNLYTYGDSGDNTTGVLFFNAAANNYIYGSGTQLSFVTGGAQRALIYNGGLFVTGSVAATAGVSSTVPTGAPTYFTATDGTVTALYGSAPALGGALFGTISAHDLLVYAHNAERGRFTSTGLSVTGNVSTTDPAGGAGPAWRLGVAATVSPTSPNRTLRVEIGGTTYYIHAKTTND